MKIFYIILFVTTGFFTGTKLDFKEKTTITNLEIDRMNTRVDEIKSMISANSKYNAKIAFFVDMRIPSRKHRFFVYDLVNNKIIDEGLVAHGSGSETGIKGSLKFSNAPNSNCTALGKYAIQNYYKGGFGKAYKLNGLEETNNNALKRAIVLHSYSAVPYEEQDYYISTSHGCPMINEQFFKRIEKIIDGSKSNIILDIYY